MTPHPFGAALLAAASILFVAAPAPRADERDPSARLTVVSVPSRPQREDGVLSVHVRVAPQPLVGRVVLWFRGESDPIFRPYPMRRVDGGIYAARLGPWRARGREVRYFVEAWDVDGGGRAALGDRIAPVAVRLVAAPAIEGAGVGTSALWLGILAAALLGALLCGIRMRRRLPPPAPRLGADGGFRLIPILVNAAGSVPSETVYLRVRSDGSSAPAAPGAAPRGRRRASRTDSRPGPGPSSRAR